MLTRLTRTLRWRAAVIITVLYALCSLAPSVSLAFAAGLIAAHCLTSDHRGAAKSQAHSHDHGTGAAHSHTDEGGAASTPDEANSPPGSCCGIFCVTALPAANHVTIGQPVHATAYVPGSQESLSGRGPDRLNRPPIASLSL